jgi:hypothetical protein
MRAARERSYPTLMRAAATARPSGMF